MDALIKSMEEGRELDRGQIGEAASMLLDEAVENETKAGFLRALTAKGESAGEIAGFVESFLERAVDPRVQEMNFDGPTIDIVGTGGDRLHLFNVSTTSMFVMAAGGAVVMKHGNRGVTSKSGGADVLEALGIDIEMPPAMFRKALETAGVGFLFAPIYHPAFKAVAPVRAMLAKEGVRTIFNLLGPLLNPARPECQLVGVCEPALGAVFSDILARLGRERAWVVSGQTADGAAVDEMSLMGPTHISRSGRKLERSQETVLPEDLSLDLCEVADLQGGDAAENADILTAVLQGRDRGPKREMVRLNAGAGLACAGLVDSLSEGVSLAASLIDSGQAYERLRRLQELSSGGA